MLSGPLSNLSPGELAYLALVITGFLAISLTLAIIPSWSDQGRPKSGRPVKTIKAARPRPQQPSDHKKAA